MRDYAQETQKRVAFIRQLLADAGAEGIVFGNSGGKDSALVGILCKLACEQVTGVIMPCQSTRNFGEDLTDGEAVAEQFGIDGMLVDLSEVKALLCEKIGQQISPRDDAVANIAPRLRMTTLYTIAQSKNCLVAGTGNRSESYMGYFTKWGDGAYDFNPIADLTVTEIYEFLEYLNAPENIRKKTPSAGLYEGQTDEQEMKVTYADIDKFLLEGDTSVPGMERIRQMHRRSEHKRRPAVVYPG